jgi:hypothetical protein
MLPGAVAPSGRLPARAACHGASGLSAIFLLVINETELTTRPDSADIGKATEAPFGLSNSYLMNAGSDSSAADQLWAFSAHRCIVPLKWRAY